MASEGIQMIVELLRSRPANPNPNVAEMRANFTAIASVATDITRTPVDVDGVPGEWVSAPGADPGRAMLYLHGGGYAIGSIVSHRELGSRIARASGAAVLVIDYRLAPESPFPAAVEDAVKAYRWLLAQGYAPESLSIAGDSAGGGLTAATLVSLRDQGIALPACAALLSPWTDLAFTGDSITSRAALDPMIASDGVGETAAMYLGGADPKTPLASPLYADLTDLPPLLIQVGTSEVLFDDATRFDARARTAGVEVTFEAWNDMIHVFQMFASFVPEGQQAIEHIGAFVRARSVSRVPAGVA